MHPASSLSPRFPAPCDGGKQRGVALALLLWIVAALSLLVSGLTYLARTDVQLTALQRDQAQAQAAATGVGHLLLHELLLARAAGDYDGRGIFARGYQFNGLELVARAVPASGFVSLNMASGELLAGLFRHHGGLAPGQAEILAEDVLAWRANVLRLGPEEATLPEPQAGAQGGPFQVVEDLLRVPGVSRALYDRVSPVVHALSAGQAGVDPAAAPAAVLRVLADGDQAVAAAVQESRQDMASAEAGAYNALVPTYLSAGGSTAYCLEIDVTMTDGRVFQQRIWVDTAAGAKGLPWRYTRVLPIVPLVTRSEVADGR